MHRQRSVILVTGFGPFPGAPRNASSALAEALAEAAPRRLPGFSIIAETLPTEWEAGPNKLDQLVAAHDPVVVIHFGVSPRARGFVVETRARNVRDDIKDACGAGPGDICIADAGPVELGATLPTTLINERLRKRGISVQLSRDAGGYLCNAVLYHSLNTANTARRGVGASTSGGLGRRSGFIHIPDRLAQRPGLGSRRAAASLLDWSSAIEGGIEILAVSAGVGER